MKLTQLATGLLLAGLMTGSALAADKIVIAHRGASAEPVIRPASSRPVVT